MHIVLDIENTVDFTDDGIDGTPYNPKNKLVMVQYHVIETGEKNYLVFNHNEWVHETGYLENTALRKLLESATVIIGHNLKHDMSWLFECGFEYSGEYWDTMFFEYVNARGLKLGLSLKDSCERAGVTTKSRILQDYLDKEINIDAVPLAELAEYGMGDIQSTLELYQHQQMLMTPGTLIAGMKPAIDLMNELLPVIVEMERNGCYINLEELAAVRTEYLVEQERLENILHKMVAEVMGDTPINLNSPMDLCRVIYSREVIDKEVWKNTFRLGTNERNGIKKRRKPKRYEKPEFNKIVKEQMRTEYRTEAFQCDNCSGKGKIRKIKQDGTDFKKETKCPQCDGAGFQYIYLDKVAGFKVQPLGSHIVTSNGFAADKKTIQLLIEAGKLSTEAKEFLETLSRLNAVQTYLSTFVDGIQRNTREDKLLHTSLNQCITATGRLSSSNPNFQNLPRSKTFPIRRVVQSRFKGGYILEVDWAALEYRVAVLLSKDKAGIESIMTGKDRHAVTAKILFGVDSSDPEFKNYRQNAKAETFKPLYGGSYGTFDQMAYYRAFKEEHVELTRYQMALCSHVVKHGYMVSPSGRVYAFPGTVRKNAQEVTNQTMIYNYNIQGFATADIMPAALVYLYGLMQKSMLQSKLILTVHDSVEIDVHPDELMQVIDLVYKAFGAIESELERRFNFKCCVPLGFEVSYGSNWMEKKEIHYDVDTQKIVA